LSFKLFPIIEDFRKPLFNVDYGDEKLFLDISFSSMKWSFYAVSKVLGVFDVLSDEPKTCLDLSKELGLNDKALEMVLDLLTGLKLIGRSSDGYYAKPVSKLIRFRYGYGIEAVRYNPFLRRFIRILKGERLKPLSEGHDWGDIGLQLSFAATALCGEFQRTLKYIEREDVLSKARSLIDVGGGHGLYSIGFCKLYPNLKAVVFDLEQTIRVAGKFVEKYSMSNRIKLVKGDALMDEFKGVYDVAFMSDVTFRKKDAEKVIGKIYDILSDNGVFIIKDIVPLKYWFNAPYALMHEISMLIEVGSIDYYSKPPTMVEYMEMCRRKGFKRARVLGWITRGWTSIGIAYK